MESPREVAVSWDPWNRSKKTPECFELLECSDIACDYCGHRDECIEISDEASPDDL